MTDAVFHPAIRSSRADSTPHLRRFAALRRSFGRATTARSTRRALDELPDNLLRDIGLTRSEIPFIIGALASGTPMSAAQATKLARSHPMVSVKMIV